MVHVYVLYYVITKLINDGHGSSFFDEWRKIIKCGRLFCMVFYSHSCLLDLCIRIEKKDSHYNFETLFRSKTSERQFSIDYLLQANNSGVSCCASSTFLLILVSNASYAQYSCACLSLRSCYRRNIEEYFSL